MMTLEDIEYTTKKRISREVNLLEVNSYSTTVDLYKRHNSIHLSLNFGAGIWKQEAPLPLMSLAVSRFMSRLIEVAGVKENKVVHFGYLFVRDSKGRKHPHIHMLVYNTKDYRTGNTVARMNKGQKETLATIWKELSQWNRSKGEALRIKRVHDAPGLFRYWTRKSNMMLPGQQWLSLQPYNLELLAQKMRIAA